MSELKEHLFCECDECIREYRGPLSNEMHPYYLKSEADKVIEEKDKEIQRLENLCESYRIDCDNLAIREANACKEIERDNKQIRHQKYKRCLAMAEICRHEWCVLYYERKQYRENPFLDHLKERKNRHREKWLELAERFKEAK